MGAAECLAAAAGSKVGPTDAPHAQQVYGMQPRWKKYLKLPRHAATEAKFNEIIKALEALAEVAWKLQEGPNPSTRCAPSSAPCGVAMRHLLLQGYAMWHEASRGAARPYDLPRMGSPPSLLSAPQALNLVAAGNALGSLNHSVL